MHDVYMTSLCKHYKAPFITSRLFKQTNAHTSRTEIVSHGIFQSVLPPVKQIVIKGFVQATSIVLCN